MTSEHLENKAQVWWTIVSAFLLYILVIIRKLIRSHHVEKSSLNILLADSFCVTFQHFSLSCAFKPLVFILGWSIPLKEVQLDLITLVCVCNWIWAPGTAKPHSPSFCIGKIRDVCRWDGHCGCEEQLQTGTPVAMTHTPEKRGN